MNINIQSVRGIAIIFVILFHFFPGKFPQGFLGVDMFFVISGFLIYQIGENSNFKFWDFLSRRLYRLLPLFLITSILLLLVVISTPYLISFQIKNIARDIFLSSTGMINIFYMYQDSYFSLNKYERPLLMMWSLAMEVQFYLLFGITKKINKNKYVVFTISYFISILIFIYGFANSDSNLFYNPFGRYWEFLTGVFAGVILKKYKNKLIRYQKLLELFGCLGLICSILFIDPHAFQPSIFALPMVIGCAILILASNLDQILLIAKIPYLKWFGDYSYGLYLFHWPILSLLYIYLLSLPVFYIKITTILLSMLIAFLATKYIETPIRKKIYCV